LIEERRAGWSEALAARRRRLELAPPPLPPVGDFDPARLGQAFDDLVAWRAGAGAPGSALRLAWGVQGGSFVVRWDEPAGSGPGPGPGPDDGLGAQAVRVVPLLTRIMTLHGGSVEATARDGWQLTLRWPLDVRHGARD
jgi:hypothetical protein